MRLPFALSKRGPWAWLREGILEDKKFLADLSANCKTKGAEHAENQKLRSQELLALADTIKVGVGVFAWEVMHESL